MVEEIRQRGVMPNGEQWLRRSVKRKSGKTRSLKEKISG